MSFSNSVRSSGLLGFALAGLFCATGAQAFAAPTTLFTLERTTNANQVDYELKTDGSIHPFWRMLAQDGHTEELTAFERAEAYGAVVMSENSDRVEFSIKALPAYPITVALNPPVGQPYATIQLMGAARSIKQIYLHVSGGLFPKVSSIDIEAQNGDVGPLLYFNLEKNGSGFKESQINCAAEWPPGC